MMAVAHSPAFAKKVGVQQSVGKDFNQADKGKTFKQGGTMKKHDDAAQDKALIKKMMAQEEKKEPKGMAKGGSVKPSSMSKDVEAGSNKLIKFGESAVQKRGHTKGTNLGDSGKTVGIQGMKCGGSAKKMAKGGTAYARADGIASKGKTKGKWC